jgi:hypothetical protein
MSTLTWVRLAWLLVVERLRLSLDYSPKVGFLERFPRSRRCAERWLATWKLAGEKLTFR